MKIIDSFGPVEIVDSFVMGVLKKGKGHGEGRLYIGSQSNNQRLNSFFNNFNPLNKYKLSFSEINRYLEVNEDLYTNPIDKFKNPKAIPGHFSALSQVYKGNPSGNLILSFSEATGTKDKHRRFVRYPKNNPASEAAWAQLRQIFLPNRATLTFHKTDAKNFYEVTVNTKEQTKEVIREIELEKEAKRLAATRKFSAKKRLALVSSRDGQGDFRDGLLKAWGRCAISGINNPSLLQACHIKDWAKADDTEKLDAENGLILSHTLHKAFDEGLICFSETGALKVSPFLSKEDAKLLGVRDGKQIFSSVSKKRKSYLNWKLARFRGSL